MNKIRVRFAPSPTGFLHVGNLRTALYDYLVARKQGGEFVLRIEDTDQTRYVEGAVETLLNTMRAVGLDYDEGPYFQSQRTEIYKKYINELVEKGSAYACFCTSERLEKLRKSQELNKQPTMYDGLCRMLNNKETQKRINAGEPHVIRLAMPKEGVTKFNDLVRGEVEFENKLIDDQILLKSDGFPTYHGAVVIDDYLMKINLVIRGEDWLSSTPKHIVLYKAFDWDLPRFAHLPLLLNADKSKLSKRQGDVAAEDFLKKGYLPEALINFIALLGWNPGTDQEIFSMQELIENFDLSRVQKSGAVFNLEKLDWMNSEYIKKKPKGELVGLCLPYLIQADLVSQVDSEAPEAKLMIEKIIAMEQDRLKKLSDLPRDVAFFFKLPAYPKEMLMWRKSDLETTRARLERLYSFYDTWDQEWTKGKLEEETMKLIKQENLDNGATLWPMRAALSGLEKSPGPFDIADVLGKNETLKRLKQALS